MNVAGWCHVAGYLEEDEAWEWVLPAARRLQKSYGSWSELGNGYCLGRQFWNPSSSDGRCEQACSALLAKPSSPWRRLAWDLDLGE